MVLNPIPVRFPLSQDDYRLAFLPCTPPSEILKWKHGYRLEREEGMLIERDVGIAMPRWYRQ